MAAVALVGFGRNGRNLFRALYRREGISIAAIADPAPPESLLYLLRFDTLLGRLPDPAELAGGDLSVAGRRIRVLSGAESDATPWSELGVHTVLEATSKTRTREELHRHLAAGAARVISLAPPPPNEDPDLLSVPGITDDRIESRQRIVSNASATVHCVAPVLRILADRFGLRRAMFTTAHAYTSFQHLADTPAEDLRGGRAAAENIIPQASRSPRMLARVLPDLAARVSAYAMNVPVQNGSVVDLVCWHERPVSVESVNEAVRAAAQSPRWRKLLGFERDPIVSSDVATTRCSAVFDSLATMTLGDRMSKTLTWFGAGCGYAERAVELLERFAEADRRPGAAA
jgi:glyceraldehyde 3-phosphate dehydrogenase